MNDNESMSYTIVGVIGHIDHGKTSLVAALTGTDTDTHPEEKRRGITIDLGFASFKTDDHEFALIDAPGHQKYIGNLLAGVSSVDVGLLVVACDQGIQEQTLEHAAILNYLGVPKLLAVVSRIDLSDEQTLADLTEELEVFLSDYGYQDVAVTPVSSTTGAGLDKLKSQLDASARTSARPDKGPFRLPIDRVFSVEGRGAVVAGTPWNGRVAVGDTLVVAQSGQDVRVREIETHSQSVQQSSIGRRTAMNITGISARDLRRGDELVAPESFVASRQHVVRLRTFRSAPDLRCPTEVQIHTATTACSARITGVRSLEADSSVVVVIETELPIVTQFDQQLLLRLPYPVGSFASGRFLASFDPPQKRKRDLITLGEGLNTEDPSARLMSWIDYCGDCTPDPMQLELGLGIAQCDLPGMIDSLVDSERTTKQEQRLLSKSGIERARTFALKLLNERVGEDDAWMNEESLLNKLEASSSSTIAKIAVDQLVSESSVVRMNRMVAIASDETKLSKKQLNRMRQIIEMFADNRTPPTVKEVAESLGASMDAISSPLRFATQQRSLTDLGGGFYISTAIFEQLCSELSELFEQKPTLSASEVKERWQVTRKHAIPLLEHCDKMGITVRDGNVRSIGPKLSESHSLPKST